MGLVEQKKQLLFADLWQKNSSNEIAKRGLQIEEERLSIAKNAGPKEPNAVVTEREFAKQRTIPGTNIEKDKQPTKDDYEQAKPIYETLVRGQNLFNELIGMAKEGYKVSPERFSAFQMKRKALANEVKKVIKSPGGENFGAALNEAEIEIMNIPDINSLVNMVPQLEVAKKSMLEKGMVGLKTRKYNLDASFLSPRQE